MSKSKQGKKENRRTKRLSLIKTLQKQFLKRRPKKRG